MFCSGPPTTSSLLSAPSTVTFPPRPSWPADEMTTVFVLVGSKFGAGAFPGISSASSRKLRPLSGRLLICRALMTPSTAVEVVSTELLELGEDRVVYLAGFEHEVDCLVLSDL